MRILTLSLVSTVALAGTALAGIQTNGVQTNGIQTNGIQTNGVQTNGIQTNGIQTNGIQTNGIQTNGTMASGVAYSGINIDGTQLSYIGQPTSVYPYSCMHREDVAGAALNNCSACSMTVANADSYCKYWSWDSICVSEAHSMCVLGAGTVMTASFSDGSTAKMKIDSVTQGASSYWNGSVYMNFSDVFYDNVSWVMDHAPNVTGGRLLGGMNSCTNQVCNVGGNGYYPDNYCCTRYWDSYCVAEANAECSDPASTVGASVCGTTGTYPYEMPTQAVFLGGVWDQHWGAQGNGGKSASRTAFTIACRGKGAYAKCLDQGYKPWISQAMDDLHQTCVRMVRADYCGDGNSFTQNGHSIDVDDYLHHVGQPTIQYYTSSYYYEASWDKFGANFADHYRIAYQASAYDGTPVNVYIGSRSAYCNITDPWAGPMNAQADGTQNLLTDKAQ